MDIKKNKESKNNVISTKKKPWHKPQIQRFDVKETLGGNPPKNVENKKWSPRVS